VKIKSSTMKTQFDFKRALCGADAGAGIFSDGTGRYLLFTGGNVAWAFDAQTGRLLTERRLSASHLNHQEEFTKPELSGPKTNDCRHRNNTRFP